MPCYYDVEQLMFVNVVVCVDCLACCQRQCLKHQTTQVLELYQDNYNYNYNPIVAFTDSYQAPPALMDTFFFY